MKFICSRKKEFGIKACKNCEHADDVNGRKCVHSKPHTHKGVFCENHPACIQNMEDFLLEGDFLI